MSKKLSKSQTLVVKTSTALLEALNEGGFLTQNLDNVKTFLKESRFQVNHGSKDVQPVFLDDKPKAVSGFGLWIEDLKNEMGPNRRLRPIYELKEHYNAPKRAEWRLQWEHKAAQDNAMNDVIPNSFLYGGSFAWRIVYQGDDEMVKMWRKMTQKEQNIWLVEQKLPTVLARQKFIWMPTFLVAFHKMGLGTGVMEMIALYCSHFDVKIVST